MEPLIAAVARVSLRNGQRSLFKFGMEGKLAEHRVGSVSI